VATVGKRWGLAFQKLNSRVVKSPCGILLEMLSQINAKNFEQPMAPLVGRFGSNIAIYAWEGGKCNLL